MMYKMCYNDTRNAKYDRSHESLAREQVKVGGETKMAWFDSRRRNKVENI